MENSVMSASIVRGEAAESDSEDLPITLSKKKTKAALGKAVSGEASESEDEHEIKQPSLSESSASNLSISSRHYDSLLHKKFSECYLSLYSNISGLLKNTITDSLTQLATIEQQLLKSQLRMRSATTALKSLDSTSYLLAERLNNAACSAYIPKITIPIEVDSD